MKLKKINDTTYEADFTRARVEIGDITSDKFIPCCKMYNFEGETSLKVTYVDRPYSLVTDTPEAEEVDKLILTEAVYYPPYEIGIWYDAGDLLEYNGGLYEVVQAHTSQEDWPPDTTSALYKTSTPPGVIAEWVQPEGSHDAYAIDTKVSHIGKIWISIIDANVWEPGVYGWEETDGRVDVECYCVDGIGEQNVSGFEFEIVLRERPVSNVVEMAIETEGLKFYYQPELTQAEIDEGATRPENVVGSYAVYHATCGNMHKGQATAQKYQTGKAFHIYRPKVVDANGDWIWGELSIDSEAGILSITVDQQWLDSAVYPVRVDPTFGYVDENGDGIVGGSIQSSVGGNHVSYQIPGYSVNEEGFIIEAYFRGYSGDGDVQSRKAIYRDSTQNVFSESIGEVTITTTEQWYKYNMTRESFTPVNDEFILAIWTPTVINVKYDTAEDWHYRASNPETYESDKEWPTLSNFAQASNRQMSKYVVYEEPTPIPVPIITAVQENGNIRISWTYPA